MVKQSPIKPARKISGPIKCDQRITVNQLCHEVGAPLGHEVRSASTPGKAADARCDGKSR